MRKVNFSIFNRLFIDTLVAIRNVGILSVMKLYISTAIDRLLDYDNNYDLIKPLDPRSTIPNKLNVEHATIYVPSSARPFLKMIESINLDKENTVFVDLGCGKGRALLFAAAAGIKRIKGIEFCDTMSKIALNNTKLYLKSSKLQDSIDNFTNEVEFKIINKDMIEYDFDKEDNLFYFYNPCNEFVLNQVVQNIISSFNKTPRFGMIIYQNNIIKSSVFFDKFKELYFLNCREYGGNRFFIYKINSNT